MSFKPDHHYQVIDIGELRQQIFALLQTNQLANHTDGILTLIGKYMDADIQQVVEQAQRLSQDPAIRYWDLPTESIQVLDTIGPEIATMMYMTLQEQGMFSVAGGNLDFPYYVDRVYFNNMYLVKEPEHHIENVL